MKNVIDDALNDYVDSFRESQEELKRHNRKMLIIRGCAYASAFIGGFVSSALETSK